MERGGIIKHDLSKAPRTGDWRYMRPEVDKAKCIGCETCVKYCPDACISMLTDNLPASTRKDESSSTRGGQPTTDNKNAKPKAEIDYEWCKGCGVCAQVCPVKAIIMKK